MPARTIEGGPPEFAGRPHQAVGRGELAAPALEADAQGAAEPFVGEQQVTGAGTGFVFALAQEWFDDRETRTNAVSTTYHLL